MPVVGSLITLPYDAGDIVAIVSPDEWILTTGFWNDDGVWVDSDVWID